MKTRLVIDGNAVYEIDEECEACQNGGPYCPERRKRIEKMDKNESKEIEPENRWDRKNPSFHEGSSQKSV